MAADGGSGSRPDDEPETVWRAGNDRVGSGSIRRHGESAYDEEDEPAQAVDDRPPRSTTGTSTSDSSGLSSAEPGAAKTTQGVDRIAAEDRARQDAERRFDGSGPEDRLDHDPGPAP